MTQKKEGSTSNIFPRSRDLEPAKLSGPSSSRFLLAIQKFFLKQAEIQKAALLSPRLDILLPEIFASPAAQARPLLTLRSRRASPSRFLSLYTALFSSSRLLILDWSYVSL